MSMPTRKASIHTSCATPYTTGPVRIAIWVIQLRVQNEPAVPR